MDIFINHTATLDLTAIRNDSLDYTFELLDEENNAVNFSAYTGAKMSLKTDEYSTAVVTFTSTGATYQIDMSQKADGKIRVVANNTTAISTGVYLYDLELYSTTIRETIVQGKITVVPDITT